MGLILVTIVVVWNMVYKYSEIIKHKPSQYKQQQTIIWGKDHLNFRKIFLRLTQMHRFKCFPHMQLVITKVWNWFCLHWIVLAEQKSLGKLTETLQKRLDTNIKIQRGHEYQNTAVQVYTIKIVFIFNTD